MKNKNFLVFCIALLAVVLSLNSVIALADITGVKVNGVEAEDSSITIAETVSNIIYVYIEFVADEDASDVRVKAYIEGYKTEISDTTERFQIVENSKYSKRLKLTLPSSMDLDDLDEELYLNIRISAKGEESVDEPYDIVLNMQKEIYSFNFLSIEANDKAVAGDTIPLNIVLQNNGYNRMDNVYVKASIPELGIEKKVYFGDLSPNQEDDYGEIRDTAEGKIYLAIPRNAVPGIYNIDVEAYNYDTSVSEKKQITINNVQTGVLPATNAKVVSAGEETTFEVVLVNPNNRMVVYSIVPQESSGLLVTVPEPIVTVPADSSITALVKVKATNSAEEGTHIVTVNVNSESGFVKQVNFALNVENSSNSMIVGLTIVLAIVFVVLLVALIVLLTKKPANETEEFGETNYY